MNCLDQLLIRASSKPKRISALFVVSFKVKFSWLATASFKRFFDCVQRNAFMSAPSHDVRPDTLQMQQQVADSHVRSYVLKSAIDHLSIGIVFVDSKAVVVLFNRTAEELLRRNDGLLLVHNRLHASSHRESSGLEAMITKAVQTGNDNGFARGTTLLSRRTGRPLAVTAVPLPQVGLGFVQTPFAILFISDPDQKIEVPADFLRRCYGLTVAEARLATVLVEGRSLKEAADLCGVTHNTVRSQLKAIFMKTDVQRQAQLIRVILTSALLRTEVFG
jgi:DNA-binding CsgD family transcriptional regulator